MLRNGPDSPLRVLMVAPELYPWRADGVTEVVRGLSNALAGREEVQLSVLATVPGGAEPYEAGYSRRIEFHKVRKYRLPEPFFHLYVMTAYAIVVLLWAWRSRNSARIVHFEVLPGTRAGLAAVASLFARLPRLVTIHGWPPNEIPLEKTLRRRAGHRAHWLLAKALLRFFPTVVVNSRHMHRLATSRLKRQEVVVIPNGIDWEFWRRGVNPPNSSRLGFGWWGSFEKWKEVGVLLEAYSTLLARMNGRCPPLYLAGGGALLPAVQGWIGERNLARHVNVLGRLDHHEIQKLSERLSIVVSPSRYEAFGIAALEAMASGKAVVVADEGGPCEFVKDRENGLHFRAGDPENLGAALLELCSDAALRERLASSAKASAREFDWREIAARHADLFRRIARGEDCRI
ncbi:MAG TPA: glycosyltransferase family 4 protein [Terriglobia bacterium]|nr:glycosyltransferase family 4 protein [Terriglobia bacterium]